MRGQRSVRQLALSDSQAAGLDCAMDVADLRYDSIAEKSFTMSALNINGRERTVDVDPGTPILWALRDSLGMTGTKFGCGAALCGAVRARCIWTVNPSGPASLTAAVSNLLFELRGCPEFVVHLSAIYCSECQQLVVPAGFGCLSCRGDLGGCQRCDISIRARRDITTQPLQL